MIKLKLKETDDLDEISGVGIYKFNEENKLDLDLTPMILIAERIDKDDNESEFERNVNKRNIRIEIHKL